MGDVFVYDPGNPELVRDFGEFDRVELEELEAEGGHDFSAHPRRSGPYPEWVTRQAEQAADQQRAEEELAAAVRRMSWKQLARVLAARLESHASCPEHWESEAQDDCPFCQDRRAFRLWQRKAGVG